MKEKLKKSDDQRKNENKTSYYTVNEKVKENKIKISPDYNNKKFIINKKKNYKR